MKQQDSVYHLSDSLKIFDEYQTDTVLNQISTRFLSDNLSLINPTESEAPLFTSFYPDWLTIVFLFGFIYIVVIRLLFQVQLSDVIKGLLKIEVLDQVGFDKSNRAITLLMAPLSLFVFPYYLYFIVNPRTLNLELDYLYLVFVGLILLLFILKKSIELFIAIVFNTQKAYVAYTLDQVYLIGVSSVFQMILLVFYTYSQQRIFLWLSVMLLVVFFVYRLVRSFIIGFKLTEFSKSYLFLYLCSLEILPLIWLMKWFSELYN